MKDYRIVLPEPFHWKAISGLISKAIPNAVISMLGIKTGALYYRNISQNKNSCCFIAVDNNQTVAGVIIGTTDRSQAKKISLNLKVKLLIYTNIRLLSIGVIKWIGKGILVKFKKTQNQILSLPTSELVAIAVEPALRGTKIAYDLVEKLETFFKNKGCQGPYLILTEKINLRANRFYSKIGAKFIAEHPYHGRGINLWYKDLD